MVIAKIKISKLLGILKEFVNKKNYINNYEQKRILLMFEKMSEKAKYDFILHPELIFYIKNMASFMQEAKSVYIVDVNNKLYAYLYYKILDSYYEHIINEEEIYQFSNIEINICCKKASVDTDYLISIQKILHSSLSLIEYAKDYTSIIDLKKIDSCYSGKPTDIAKYAKRSIVGTLLGYKIENSFRKHPECKYRIVGLDELKKIHLDISDRQIGTNCPVCSKKITITKKNIEQIVMVKNNLVTFNCDHLNTKYIKEYPYSTDLSKYFEDYKPVDIVKRMFFLNNIGQLVQQSNREVNDIV